MKRGVERRGSKRFEVKVPAIISHPAGDGKGKECHMLLTRDISNSGAYLTMMKPIFYDGPMEIEILLEVSTERKHYVCMTTNGKIVRRTETGIAVNFDEEFSLSPFPSH